MSLFTPKTITLRDGVQMLLRSPELDEAPQLIDYLDTVRRETGFLMWSPGDDLPDVESETKWIKARREEEGGITILSKAEGQVASICGVDRHGPFVRIRHCAELGISIRKEWCGRGLGTVLLGELINWAEDYDGLEVVSLGVIDGNDRAKALYIKHGFEETGRKRWHVKRDGKYMDEIIMSRWVGSAELVP